MDKTEFDIEKCSEYLAETYRSLKTKEGRRIRERAGYTLEGLAELTGIDMSHLSKFERGLIYPNSDNAIKYGHALEVMRNMPIKARA